MPFRKRLISTDDESSPLSEVLTKERNNSPRKERNASPLPSTSSKKTRTEKKSSENATEASNNAKVRGKKPESSSSRKYDKNEPRHCKVCNKWFTSEFVLSAHMETHSVGEKKRNGSGDTSRKKTSEKSDNQVIFTFSTLDKNSRQNEKSYFVKSKFVYFQRFDELFY